MNWISVFTAFVLPILPLSLLVIGEYLQRSTNPVYCRTMESCKVTDHN